MKPSLTGRLPSQPSLQNLPIGSLEAARLRLAMATPFWRYKVLKPKLTALLCCYVWGYTKPEEIWITPK